MRALVPAFTAAAVLPVLAVNPCLLVFVKADGTVRQMLTTPTGQEPRMRGHAVPVWDAVAEEWRSFRIDRLLSVAILPEGAALTLVPQA